MSSKKSLKQYNSLRIIRHHLLINAEQEKPILINVNGKEYLANNQTIILEQLEMYGLQIPYACRAGVCGCCKMKLIAGKVFLLAKTAIKKHGILLSCSCIPKTNITLLCN
ncbi:MAG: 2Fe-2S iron-sulfur cluster binding domain-containing protein [Candidatus Arsenophonus melophagi]|nr:2Fe-2S iron-sulfur cluster binding domain-containing protein [Candidatus Arsenophonus melophagi]